jgi:pilus assembly protein Flp/PilA
MFGEFNEFAIQWIKDNWKKEEGQAMAEYGIILALIAAVVIASLVLLGKQVKAAFDAITGALPGIGG